MSETTTTRSRIRYRDEDGVREGKLLALKSYSNREEAPLTLKNFVVGVDIVSFLAWKHFQERDGSVGLPYRNEFKSVWNPSTSNSS